MRSPKCPHGLLLIGLGVMALIGAMLTILDVRSTHRTQRLAALVEEANRDAEEYVEEYMADVRARARRQPGSVTRLRRRP